MGCSCIHAHRSHLIHIVSGCLWISIAVRIYECQWENSLVQTWCNYYWQNHHYSNCKTPYIYTESVTGQKNPLYVYFHLAKKKLLHFNNYAPKWDFQNNEVKFWGYMYFALENGPFLSFMQHNWIQPHIVYIVDVTFSVILPTMHWTPILQSVVFLTKQVFNYVELVRAVYCLVFLN